MKPTIGFIGLGEMGRPMAGHLLDGGHSVATATHRSPPPQVLLDKGLLQLQLLAEGEHRAGLVGLGGGRRRQRFR